MHSASVGSECDFEVNLVVVICLAHEWSTRVLRSLPHKCGLRPCVVACGLLWLSRVYDLECSKLKSNDYTRYALSLYVLRLLHVEMQRVMITRFTHCEFMHRKP